MSVDIYLDKDGILQRSDTDLYKAKNILSIQVTDVYYAQDLGIDLRRFMNPDVKIQFETFRSYTIQQMVQQGVRVNDALEMQNFLDKDLDYSISTTQNEGMIL